MLHLEFMIAESSKIKARALSITSMSLSALVRQRTMRLSIPTPACISHTYRRLPWLILAQDPVLPRHVVLMERSVDDSGTLQATMQVSLTRERRLLKRTTKTQIMISCVHPSSGGPIRTSGGRIKGGPEQSVTMADVQLLELDIRGDDDAVVENDGTTSGSSELWEEAFGTETQAGLQVSPDAEHISWQRRSSLVPRALSWAKPTVVAAYKDEYNRFSRDQLLVDWTRWLF